MKRLSMSGFVLVSALMALGANAEPIHSITMEYNGFANGSEKVRIHHPERSVTVLAGQFEFDHVQGPEPAFWDGTLQAFCIDVTDNLVTSGKITYSIATGSSQELGKSQFSLISQLYDGYASKLGDAIHDAAFQLALWEVMYDTSPLSLVQGSTGDFYATGGSASARQMAEKWLDELDPLDHSYTSHSFEFYVLNPYDPSPNQRLLVARSVPEAGALGLLGLGLMALGTSRRRRASRR